MAEEIKKLVEEYRDGKLSRREFMHKAILLTGSLAAATSLAACAVGAGRESGSAQSDDLVSTNVQFKGPAGTVFGYLSRPKEAGSYPAIIVIHANQGLDDHIRDVVRRFAKQGYVALAPDYLSRKGGTVKFPDAGKGLPNMRELVTQDIIKGDTDAALGYLKSLKEVRSDRIGITGFCFGGEQTFYAATQARGLKAVVVFYGRSPNPLDLVQQIEAPVLAHYGELDKAISGTVPQTEAAMKKYNKSYTYKIYPGAQHAFFNDASPERYNPEAAKEAWGKTLDFFKKNLQS
jgi:carboxymethylenebutenolidase